MRERRHAADRNATGLERRHGGASVEVPTMGSRPWGLSKRPLGAREERGRHDGIESRLDAGGMVPWVLRIKSIVIVM
jgi:hypothetical protein